MTDTDTPDAGPMRYGATGPHANLYGGAGILYLDPAWLRQLADDYRESDLTSEDAYCPRCGRPVDQMTTYVSDYLGDVQLGSHLRPCGHAVSAIVWVTTGSRVGTLVRHYAAEIAADVAERTDRAVELGARTDDP